MADELPKEEEKDVFVGKNKILRSHSSKNTN